jgi:hypothetical protein
MTCKKIISLYKSGSTYKSIQKELSLPYNQVRQCIRDAGLIGSKQKKPLDEKSQGEASRLYESGLSIREVSESLGVSATAIHTALEAFGTKKRTLSVAQRRYKINDNAFSDTSDPEACYWAGFILADGCIRLGGSAGYSIEVGIQREDENHLLKLARFLDTDRKVDRPTLNLSRLRVNSEKICKDLHAFGVVPVKSKVASIPLEFRRNRDFLRGLVDGDGTLYTNKLKGKNYLRLALVGSKPVVSQFSEYISEVAGKKINIYSTSSIFGTSICGKNAIKLADKLYRNAEIFLDRKKAIYERYKIS